MTTLTKIRLDGVEYDLGGGSSVDLSNYVKKVQDTSGDVVNIQGGASTDSGGTLYLGGSTSASGSGGWELGAKDGQTSYAWEGLSDGKIHLLGFTSNGLKQDTVAYLSDLSGYALTSSLATVATSGSYSDLSNKPSLDYLPLAGGTMTGAVTRNGTLAQSGDTSGSISIQNGTSAAGGGGIWMYGASNANAGKVRLQAYDSTNKKYCALDANGDGTLTWCGNSVATDNNVVHTTGNETVEGLKTFTEGIAIDRSDTTTTEGEMVGAFTLKYKNASGTDVNCYPIQYISGTGTANNTLAFGSSNGGTIIGAGEGGKRIYATNNTAANSESLFLAADGGIWGYAGCANDGSGGTNIFMGNSAGMNFYVPTTAPTAAAGDSSTRVATTEFVTNAIASITNADSTGY